MASLSWNAWTQEWSPSNPGLLGSREFPSLQEMVLPTLLLAPGTLARLSFSNHQKQDWTGQDGRDTVDTPPLPSRPPPSPGPLPTPAPPPSPLLEPVSLCIVCSSQSGNVGDNTESSLVSSLTRVSFLGSPQSEDEHPRASEASRATQWLGVPETEMVPQVLDVACRGSDSVRRATSREVLLCTGGPESGIPYRVIRWLCTVGPRGSR